MYRNKNFISTRTKRLLKSVLSPSESELSESDDEELINYPALPFYYDSDRISSSPPSWASDLESLLNINDIPMFDELGTNINEFITYFT